MTDVWLKRRSPWGQQQDDARDEFDVDYARVVHSGSFRRLQGKTQILNRSRSLANAMRRSMIVLRLDQLAAQQASECGKDDDTLRTYRPVEPARQLIDINSIWRANNAETLQQALDKAQITIIAALKSDDPQQRLNAAKLMLRTKQARDRGL